MPLFGSHLHQSPFTHFVAGTANLFYRSKTVILFSYYYYLLIKEFIIVQILLIFSHYVYDTQFAPTR